MAVRAAGRVGVAGAVVLLHGGQSVSREPTSPVQPSVLRMVPIAGAVRLAVRGRGVVVTRPRFRLRGWNGSEATPVPDLQAALDALPDVPVVLIGHSMGARTALRLAGHPKVRAIAGLAPWLPRGEPVEQLAGRRVLLVHGTADTVTDPEDTWAYAARARAVTRVDSIQLVGGDHAMLRRSRLWHRLAADFARSCFDDDHHHQPSAESSHLAL